ncbi:TrmB family transcriptional regulator [Halobacteria archaeon AArc-dxtr1]|nr:TrmB family transcriptional regulator [Halobacteria archaeon AArc-dxtr1]
MSTEDLSTDFQQIMQKFDVKKYEIEGYVTVVEHGALTARELAEHSSIPQSRVYDVARSLAETGLVEVHESRPIRIVAVDPEEAFSKHICELNNVVEDLKREYNSPTEKMENGSLVKSRSTILRYIDEVIASAERELFISLTPGLLEKFEDELRDAAARNVTTSLIVSPASRASSSEFFDYDSVATDARARRGVTTPVVAVADGSYLVYASRELIKNKTDDYGVILCDSEMVSIAIEFFQSTIWTTSERQLSASNTQIGFPQQYASIQHCKRDLAVLDEPVYARIVGRDVLTGEQREITGKVELTHSEGYPGNTHIDSFAIKSGNERMLIGDRFASHQDVEARTIEINDQPYAKEQRYSETKLKEGVS